MGDLSLQAGSLQQLWDLKAEDLTSKGFSIAAWSSESGEMRSGQSWSGALFSSSACQDASDLPKEKFNFEGKNIQLMVEVQSD